MRSGENTLLEVLISAFFGALNATIRGNFGDESCVGRLILSLDTDVLAAGASSRDVTT